LIVSQQNSFDDCSLTEAIQDNVFFIHVQADAQARLELENQSFCPPR